MQPSASPTLRQAIAAAAARLIADDGLDYGSAKQKAAREVAGGDRLPRNTLPDNDEIDTALREHLALFDDAHPARLARMRAVALELMRALADFQPMATGAVWKGIATEHAPIHLQLFHDNPKDVEIALLNEGVDFEVSTVPHFRSGTGVEAIGFWLDDAPVLLSLYAHDDLRGALRSGPDGAERGDRAALLERLAHA